MSFFNKKLAVTAAETFVVAFIAVEPVANLVGMASGSQPVDLSALRAAGVAGLFAAVAVVYAAAKSYFAAPAA